MGGNLSAGRGHVYVSSRSKVSKYSLQGQGTHYLHSALDPVLYRHYDVFGLALFLDFAGICLFFSGLGYPFTISRTNPEDPLVH